MTVRTLPLAGTMALAVILSGCSMAGIKPLPGNKSASAAIASLAPEGPTATPAGHVPKAANVPRAASEVLLGFAQSERGSLDGLISHYSNAYGVPESLVRRVIVRESGYNPAARNGPYYGLMQISHATARGMGYGGEAAGLLDAETNLRFAVRYLAGAYVTAGGNPDRAVQFYARGYYYDAKRQGVLEKSGLR
ncbi:Transglycosylase SLT domain-containing protein [Devosia crocina]|uniref:Transglycosylase SLT domain-containing protein n=1 Tax=Devosia crocina TaxID=429728 RepID=A0A1I7NUC9_9HYPH|nr:Transglycosylase SLT domain-containing protein [Devosia crocina]